MGVIIFLLSVVLVLFIYITYLNLQILNDNKYFQICEEDLLNEIKRNTELKKQLDFYLGKEINNSKKIEKIINLLEEDKFLASDEIEKIKEILQITTTDNISK